MGLQDDRSERPADQQEPKDPVGARLSNTKNGSGADTQCPSKKAFCWGETVTQQFVACR